MKFSLDSDAIHSREILKRQNVDAGAFHDEHYATFFGGEFSNVLNFNACCFFNCDTEYIGARVLISGEAG